MVNFNNQLERKNWEAGINSMYVNYNQVENIDQILDEQKLSLEYEQTGYKLPKKTYYYGIRDNLGDTRLYLFDNCAVVQTDIPTYHYFKHNEIQKAFNMAKIRSARGTELNKMWGY
jgi:hypothetical protein